MACAPCALYRKCDVHAMHILSRSLEFRKIRNRSKSLGMTKKLISRYLKNIFILTIGDIALIKILILRIDSIHSPQSRLSNSIVQREFCFNRPNNTSSDVTFCVLDAISVNELSF